MVKGKSTLKIGLLLTGNYNWVGGLYYVINIIKTFNSIDESKKPEIVVFYNNQTPKELLTDIQFLNVKFQNLDRFNFLLKAYYKTVRILTKRNYQLEKIINPHNLDVLYPLSQYFFDLQNINCKIVYWIYDFQHKFLPQLFEPDEIAGRDRTFNEIATFANNIVVSSEDANTHFKQFYPNSKAKVHVLRFVSIININNLSSYETIKNKYKITTPYFVVANQFWIHKNHMIVIEAIKLLKTKELRFKIYFTGKQHDHRSPDYFKKLTDFIQENNLNEYVSFTGFIARNEQLSLIKYAKAIIQPSKFEGWSTVVEDSKALNKKIILSNIPVHIEQVKQNADYFFPDDACALAEYIEHLIETDSPITIVDYQLEIERFADDLIQTFTSVN